MSDDAECGQIKNDGVRCDYPAKHEDGRCGIHSKHSSFHSGGGRPSKFNEVRDDLIEAADSYLNHEQVAGKGGVAKKTLYTYFDEHEEFLHSFKRARADAAQRLIDEALDPDSDVDMKFAKFLLERSFKFIKTERKEVDASVDFSESDFEFEYGAA